MVEEVSSVGGCDDDDKVGDNGDRGLEGLVNVMTIF